MSDIESRIAGTRADLDATLDAIEDKLNLPKQFGELTRKAKASYAANPIPWIIAASAATATIVGLIAWAIFSDDD